MRYIHKASGQAHGSLTSNKCVVDSRWVLKVILYGIDAFDIDMEDEELGGNLTTNSYIIHIGI